MVNWLTTKEPRICNRERTVSFNRWCGKDWAASCKRNWGTVLHLTQKLMQCINGLNVKTKTIKFLNENTGSKLLDIHLSDIFWIWYPKEKKKKRTNGTTSLKSFCTAEKMTNKMNKGSLWNRGNIRVISDKELISKVHTELIQQQKIKTPNNPIKRWVDLNKYLPKRHTDGQQVQKSCSISLIIRERQVNTTMISPHTCQKGH